MSTPKRFFIENLKYPENPEVILDGEEFIHAKTVLRVEEGTEIVLLDNSGTECPAIVQKVEKHRLLAHITGATVGDKEPKAQIYLLCGALKGDKTELIVQKATELGVSRIGVFSSEFCSAYMNDSKKLERLKKVAREAAKQCLRSRAPEIEYYPTLDAALKSAEGYDNKLFACEFLEDSDGDISSIKGSTAVVVGSEGGFSQNEYAYAKSLNFTGISLGKRILRAETAAISVCALVAYFLGELK
ncbi:MAG: 16S rRNA (uracil(1498)-N(3))-methyltransferase [Clostridiales bacterium]|nr:16S rRNA (uracil(1498)-N(3))-methyltransferase [Clostridiales bacterium]